MYSNVLVVFAAAALVSANDIFETANHTEGHKLVFDGHFEAQWAMTRQVKDVFVNSSEIITGINVTDLREGKDGEAHIVSGGIGHENVTISLKSPAVFRGFDFMVEVFSAGADEIERGPRGVQATEPAKIPQEPIEDKTQTRVPAHVTTPKPEVTGLPIGTGVPDAAGFPTVTPKSEVTGLPVGTGMPDAAEPPKVTLKSEVTGLPVGTGMPGAAEPPKVTLKSEVTGLPVGTGVPDAAGFPTVTPKSEVTGLPVGTGVPDAAGLPKVTPIPEVTGLPIGTGVPDAAGFPTVTPKPDEIASLAEKAPKQKMEVPEEIEQEPKMQAFVGFYPPSTARPRQHH